MIAAFTFLAGLAVLLVAGNLVINDASEIGRRFGLSPMVVGLTVVAAGTSAPELAVVGQAVAANDTELAVGSVIGSNIANVLLVLGLAAAFGAIKVTNRAVRIEIPMMIAASVTLLIVAQDNKLDRLEGAFLVAALVVFVGWTIRAARSSNQPKPADSASQTTRRPAARSWSRWTNTLVGTAAALIVGVIGLAGAARLARDAV